MTEDVSISFEENSSEFLSVTKASKVDSGSKCLFEFVSSDKNSFVVSSFISSDKWVFRAFWNEHEAVIFSSFSPFKISSKAGGISDDWSPFTVSSRNSPFSSSQVVETAVML